MTPSFAHVATPSDAATFTRQCLERIRRYDEAIHSMISVWPRRALRQAQDTHRHHSPVAGIPAVIKDLNAVRGTRLGMGSAATRSLFTPFDDLLIARLRRAGLIFLGKATTSEFGVLPITEPTTHPPTRNPYHLDFTAGGSSGGCAAAVAAHFAPLAVGSDGGGSIRIPSCFCGLVGMKPSRGLVTNPFGLDSPELIWTCGPMAQTTIDAAALLDAMVTPRGRTDRWLAGLLKERSGCSRDESKDHSFVDSLRDPVPPLSVQWTVTTSLGEATQEATLAVQQVIDTLARLGHTTRRAAPLSSTSLDEFLPVWQRNAASAPVLDWSKTEPLTQWLARPGRSVTRSQQRELVERVTQRTLAWFADADLVVTPTVGVPAPRIGAFAGLSPRQQYEAAAQIAAFTAIFNLTGQPALNLPVAFSSHGIPLGVQLIARPRQDALLLRIASQLEAELDFARQRREHQRKHPWGQSLDSA